MPTVDLPDRQEFRLIFRDALRKGYIDLAAADADVSGTEHDYAHLIADAVDEAADRIFDSLMDWLMARGYTV